jgi:phosphatidylinositol alpha-mannosyltransferase
LTPPSNNHPLKIAIVSPYDFAYPGGVTNHVSNLAENLISRGHSVKISAPYSLDHKSSDNPIFNPIGKPIPVPTAGSVARITLSVTLSKYVVPFLQENQFDIVHIHEPVSPTLPLTFLRLVQNSALIGTFHAYAKRRRGLSISRYILRRWAQRLDQRIAVSEAANEYIQRYFPGDYDIIPNGVNIEHFAKKSKFPREFNDGKLNILFQGRMEKRKGFPHLLKAYSHVKWEYPNCRLLVVGPGNIDRESARVISERGLKDVHFVGFVSDEELPKYYQMADIYCSPATGDESQGIVLLQSMAAGTPIIASSIPGYRTVIKDNHDGLLIDPWDELQFSRQLLMLLKNKELRQRLSNKAKETVKKYDWNVVVDQIEEKYRAALRSKKTKGF